MLESFFFKNSKAQIYYQDDNFNIWKFPTQVEIGKRQQRPIILNYSIMTRAYGTFFNKDSFIDYFNNYGFDVYLMDWGKEHLFTLSGWTLDMLADARFRPDLPLIEFQFDNPHLPFAFDPEEYVSETELIYNYICDPDGEVQEDPTDRATAKAAYDLIKGGMG